MKTYQQIVKEQKVELLTIYGRLEPTDDSLRKSHPELNKKMDVVFYSDPKGKEFKARMRWDASGKPTKKTKKFVLNSFNWKFEWLKPLPSRK